MIGMIKYDKVYFDFEMAVKEQGNIPLSVGNEAHTYQYLITPLWEREFFYSRKQKFLVFITISFL